MKRKIVSIFLFTLLFAATVLPVAGNINVENTVNKETSTLESIEENKQSLSQSKEDRQDGDWDYWSNSPDMFSMNSGNVGIGQISPLDKLHVVGSIRAESPGYGGQRYIRLYASAAQEIIATNDLYIDYNGVCHFSGGKVAIAKTGPLYQLDVNGDFGCTDLYSSGNVCVGTTTPSAKLDVELSSGGAATIGSSANVASGNLAIATGESTNASGEFSTAMGGWTSATGSYSTAMGGGTMASGIMATSMGSATTASGDYSIAMGRETTADGQYSTAIGRTIEVLGQYSVGIGLDETPYTILNNYVMSIMGGNVGIGTTSPSEVLDVNGNVNATSFFGDGSSLTGVVTTETDPVFTSSAASGITTGDIDNWNTAYGWGDHAQAGYDTSDDSWTGTGDTYTTSGNVGIGTDEPEYLLDVSGGDDIVAQFSGRVKGSDAVNDDEYVTKGQVESSSNLFYTPTSTSDNFGDVGDTAWDSNYFYIKTNYGWKRLALETWETSME